MKSWLVVLDVGDVIVSTQPNAHYRALGRLLGIDWQSVSQAIEQARIVHDLELGRISVEQFAEAVRKALNAPSLTVTQLSDCWSGVIGDVIQPLVAPLRVLAEAQRLLLASNTNVIHWATVRRLLAQVGVMAPACLSFEIGAAKPNPEFFATLIRQYVEPDHCAAYVDDRADNMAAASHAGLTGWRHTDAQVTADRLTTLLN
jgi:FMN phosphatase YigB (HAD superfamily)